MHQEVAVVTPEMAFHLVAQIALDNTQGEEKVRSVSSYDDVLRVLSWKSGVPFSALRARLSESVDVLLSG